ncbi:MAG: TatD family hydrolase [bacterium]|nr:TatD family hydrolase [bacterium]
MKIIDVHTHSFPDFLAEKAMAQLMKTVDTEYKAFHKGTLKDQLRSMDEAGIRQCVVQSIATRPEQAENILKWSLEIKSDRVEPYISIHPDNTRYDDILKRAKDHDIRGIKLHPHYQGVNADDDAMFRHYEIFCKYNFIVFFHSGEDLAFPGCDNASTKRMKKVILKFPEMKVILAHYGAYREWEEVYRELAGLNVYFETSFILEEAGEEMFLKILKKHSADRVMFGTDSPWTGQRNAVQLMNKCSIPEEVREKIYHRNYEDLRERG